MIVGGSVPDRHGQLHFITASQREMGRLVSGTGYISISKSHARLSTGSLLKMPNPALTDPSHSLNLLDAEFS